MLVVGRHGDARDTRRATTATPIERRHPLHERRRRHDHRAAVLQGRGEHRRAHRPPVERRRHAARDRRRSRARPRRAGSRSRSTRPVAITAGTPVRRVVLLAVGLLRVRRRLLRELGRRQPAAARPAGHGDGAERRLRLRRGAGSRRPPSTRATTGSTSCSTTGPDTVAPIDHRAHAGAERDERRARLDRARASSTKRSTRHGHERRRSQLRDGANALVPATVTYDSGTRTAILTPDAPLAPSTDVHRDGARRRRRRRRRRRATRWPPTSRGASRRAPPPADEGPGGPILVVTSTADPFGRYLAEILQAEGLNEYLVTDISHVTPALLAGYGVVVLGEMPLSAAQATMFSRLRDRRRQPDRDAPGRRPRGPPRPHERGHARCRTATCR